MKIMDFLKIVFFSAIGILLFALAFYPPVIWVTWIEYLLETPPWIVIGQMGFFIFAALFVTVGVIFVKQTID